MTLRQYLISMCVATGLSWVAFAMVLMNVDPSTGSLLGFVLFYASLALSLIGTLSIFLFLFYHKLSRTMRPMHSSVKKSFTESVAITFVAILLGILRGAGLLNIINFALLIGSVALLVLFAYSARKSATHQNFE